MAVVPFSYFLLRRTRRDMSNALVTKDWTSICGLDRDMSLAVQVAYNDAQLEPVELLAEMARIIKLYQLLLNAA